MLQAVPKNHRRRPKTRGTTAGLAAAYEISVGAAVVAVLSEVGGILTLKKNKEHTEGFPQ